MPATRSPTKPDTRRKGSRFREDTARAKSRRHSISKPEADPKWKPLARSWFNSLKLSGQTDLWEASDWATAACAAEIFDRFLRTNNATMLLTFTRLSEKLGCMFIDRQRGKVELTDEEVIDQDEKAADEAVNTWQGRLRVVP